MAAIKHDCDIHIFDFVYDIIFILRQHLDLWMMDYLLVYFHTCFKVGAIDCQATISEELSIHTIVHGKNSNLELTGIKWSDEIYNLVVGFFACQIFY
jgi:hypothetical protein